MPFNDRFLDGRNGAVANRPSKQTSKQRSRVWHNQGRSRTASDAIPGLKILGPRILKPRILGSLNLILSPILILGAKIKRWPTGVAQAGEEQDGLRCHSSRPSSLLLYLPLATNALSCSDKVEE